MANLGLQASVGFTTSAPLPASWAQSKPGTIELVWPIVIRNWIEPRCTIASIVGNNVTVASPCGLHLKASSKHKEYQSWTPVVKSRLEHD